MLPECVCVCVYSILLSFYFSFSTSTEDVKFFGKVVLPLVDKYFKAHKDYFITTVLSGGAAAVGAVGTASLKEKEMTTTSV